MQKGIDVSHHNGDIDWAKVKESGISFAMIRTGYGISSSTQVDKKFIFNIEGAKRNGINVGVYHYSYAKSPSEASKEADFCLDIIKDYSLEYPVAYDIEDKSIAKYSKEEKTNMVKSFCDKIESKGYYAMVYCNLDWLNNHLYSHEIMPKYDLWLAKWGDKEPGNCGMWQNSDSGSVPGINGKVDTDISYIDYPSIMKAKGLNKCNKESTPSQVSKGYITHIVVKGDTLWDLANKYYKDGTKWVNIQKANNIVRDVIYVGQILKIPI